jgi:DNA-directed RNA polymerase II subunit RPB1
MNLIVPRSSRTINEIHNLSSPEQRFISYKDAFPALAECQDSLIGTAELTRTKTKMDKLHAMRMFQGIPVWHDFSRDNKREWSGREIVTTLFQETGMLINYNKPAKYYNKIWAPFRNYNPQDIQVEIDRGVLKTGILDKTAIGEGEIGGIFHIIHNQYGARAAIEASFQIQQLALTYLYNSGVTVSLRDLLITRGALKQIHQIEDGLIAESRMITDKLNEGKIIAPLGKTVEEHYEELQKEALNPGDKLYPPLFESIDPEYNNFDKLIMYGSKGKLDNFRNIATAVGQLEINGERFEENFGRRALPYFTRYDKDPRSRGYIPNSYMSGIKPPEFMFHAQETRYQLINKALSTSITGMYNRMAIKNLESHIIDNHRRVSKSGKIIQLLYGADGVDPRFLEKVPIPVARADLNTVKFEEVFDSTKPVQALFKERKSKFDTRTASLLKDEFAQLVQDRKFFITTYLGRELSAGKPYQDYIALPVNLKRIIEDTLYNLGLKNSKQPNNLDPVEAIEKVKYLCSNIVYCLLNEIQEAKQGQIPYYLQIATTTLKLMIRSYLNIATMIRMGINNQALEIIIQQVRMAYQRSLIAYGTCVGIIAAQSISEPLTQMVLDSHHSSGVASTKKKGMERVREILNAKATEKMKQPSMMIYPRKQWLKNKAKVQEIANTIEMINMVQFVNKWDIFYESYGHPVHPSFASEAKLIKEFERHHIHVKPPNDLINWCIRFNINKSKLIEKQVSMDAIYTALRKVHPYCHIVYTTDNAENIIMRVYLRNTIAKKIDINLDQIKDITHAILGTTIRGIEGINACYVKEASKNFLQEDGSIKSEKIYFIFTDGTNLRKVLMNPYIDPDTVQSDSIQETRQHFGIEEARLKIINELGDQIDNKASYRHFEIYSGEMTYTGAVTSIDRYGSAKRDTSFMLRISDASPLSVIETSAINALRDNLEGVSAPIMVGKNPHIGDLYNTFKLDEKFLAENVRNLSNILENL